MTIHSHLHYAVLVALAGWSQTYTAGGRSCKVMTRTPQIFFASRFSSTRQRTLSPSLCGLVLMSYYQNLTLSTLTIPSQSVSYSSSSWCWFATCWTPRSRLVRNLLTLRIGRRRICPWLIFWTVSFDILLPSCGFALFTPFLSSTYRLLSTIACAMWKSEASKLHLLAGRKGRFISSWLPARGMRLSFMKFWCSWN